MYFTCSMYFNIIFMQALITDVMYVFKTLKVYYNTSSHFKIINSNNVYSSRLEKNHIYQNIDPSDSLS